MRIALTGASGFIGRRLLPALTGAGHQVLALYRNPPARLPDGAEVLRGGLDAPAVLADLVAGADAVVHLAGAVRGRGLEDFLATNLDGTRNLLTAVRADLPLLLVSSLAARRPELSHYAASKRAAEDALRGSGHRPWSIVRPPAVYGPGDVELAPLFAAWQRGIGLHLHRPGARLSLLHVDDLVAWVLAWLEDPAAHHGRTAEPDDGSAGGWSWPAMLAAAGDAFGRERLLPLPVPAPLLWPLAGVLELAGAAGARLRPGAAAPPPMLSRAKLRELDWPDWVCAPGWQPSGWRPRVPLSEGLRRLQP